MPRDPRPPGLFNRLPGSIVALACLLGGIETALTLGARGLIGGPFALGWRIEAMSALGFSAPLFEHALTTRAPSVDAAMRFASFALVHQGPVHALFGLVLLLALGKAVSERFAQWAMLLILLAGSVGGALAYGIFAEGRALLVGIYPGVYGLIGAFTWALYMAADGGRSRWLAFRLIGVLLALQLLVRLFLGGGQDWIADLGGFLAGFALAWLVAPDGPARMRRWRDRIRDR